MINSPFMLAFIRQLFKLVLLLLFILCLLFIWFKFLKPTKEQPTVVINQTLVLQEITQMGKLELVKYQFKEVVEYQKEQTSYQTFNRFLPKAKAVLIVSGEAVGCIDLTRLKETNILEQEQVITIYLPEPEVCYFKIDHQKSRLYDVSNGYFVEEGEIVNEAYKAAELQLKQSALETGILQQTKENAHKVLGSLLSKVSSKKVVLTWQPVNSSK